MFITLIKSFMNFDKKKIFIVAILALSLLVGIVVDAIPNYV
jgi:hypothetical protein